jgi:hypothetical protein
MQDNKSIRLVRESNGEHKRKLYLVHISGVALPVIITLNPVDRSILTNMYAEKWILPEIRGAMYIGPLNDVIREYISSNFRIYRV